MNGVEMVILASRPVGGYLGGETARGLDYLEQDSSLVIETDLCLFSSTRSYAALRAADLDWIVGPGYSLGRVHSGEKP